MARKQIPDYRNLYALRISSNTQKVRSPNPSPKEQGENFHLPLLLTDNCLAYTKPNDEDFKTICSSV